MSRELPALLTGGDARHGVVSWARGLASELTELAGVELAAPVPPADGAVHLPFSDRLWGASPEVAATRVTGLGRGRRLTVTLHDVPQRSDGPGRFERRIACYRMVVAAAAGVVCNSAHEAALLRETGVLGVDAPAPAVIPLPVSPPAPPAAAPPGTVTASREVALLGFVYPGKGHAAAIDAAAALGESAPPVTALGGPARGHDDELAALRARARRRAVRFAVTGWLTDAELLRRCRTAAVPLAAHAHLSASGSIGSWIAAGRRPLVADSRYAREIDALRPGTIERYGPTELAEAIARALATPARTWLPAGTDTRPGPAETARAYLAWWAGR